VLPISRISKDPLVRQAELIDAAEELFLAAGYQNTMIQDIVKKVGVAQGTFYYYFASKDAVLEAIFTKHFQNMLAEIKSYHQNHVPALKQLNLFINLFYKLSYSGKPGLLAKILYKEKQGLLINQLWRKTQMISIPSLIPILERCNQEGVTHVQHMEETLAFFLGIIASLLEASSPLIHGHESNPEVVSRKIRIAEKMLDTLFSAPSGSIRFQVVDLPFSAAEECFGTVKSNLQIIK